MILTTRAVSQMPLNSSMDRWASSLMAVSCRWARKSLISWQTGSKDKSNVNKSRCLPRSSSKTSVQPRMPALQRSALTPLKPQKTTMLILSARLVPVHAIHMLLRAAWRLSSMRMVMWHRPKCPASPSIQVFRQERWLQQAPPCPSSCSLSSTAAKPWTQRSNSQSSTLSWTSKCRTSR